MFPVAALIIKSFFFAFFYRNIHCLTSEFHGTFYTKNRYRINHEAMSTISVFRVKFTLEFTSLEMKFSIEESKENDLIIKAGTGNIKTWTIRNLLFSLTLQAFFLNRMSFKNKKLFLYVQKSTDNCYLIAVDNKNSIFIPEQRKNRLKRLFENNKRFSLEGKNLWSDFFH